MILCISWQHLNYAIASLVNVQKKRQCPFRTPFFKIKNPLRCGPFRISAKCRGLLLKKCPLKHWGKFVTCPGPPVTGWVGPSLPTHPPLASPAAAHARLDTNPPTSDFRAVAQKIIPMHKAHAPQRRICPRATSLRLPPSAASCPITALASFSKTTCEATPPPPTPTLCPVVHRHPPDPPTHPVFSGEGPTP